MKKLFIFVFATVLVLGLSGCGKSNDYEGTFSNAYEVSDIDYRCEVTTLENGGEAKDTIDLLFDFKNYQLKAYHKIVATFKEGLTDEKYEEFVSNLNVLDCIEFGKTIADKCKASHLEFGSTSLGFDTVVDRKGNSIELLYHQDSGSYSYGHQKLTDSEIEEVLNQLKGSGYTCK